MSKLKDICYDMHQGINTVADKVEYYEKGYPILQSKNITKGILDLEDVRYVDEKTYNYYKEKYNPHENDILLANIGTIGKSIIVKEEDNFLIAWNIFLIKINSEKMNPKYLKIFFDYLFITKYYDKFLTGGTVKFINKKTMGEIEVPDTEIEEQQRIAIEIEKVQDIIQLKQLQLKKIGELIKSQFVEMFDSKNFKEYKLGELIENEYITYHLDGNHGGLYPRSQEFTDSGVPYIGANCINNGIIGFENAKYLKVERAKQFRKGIAKNGDVLFAHNATVGPVAILKTDLNFVILSTSLTAYRCNPKYINNYYLAEYLRSNDFVGQYINEMKQTTRSQIPITAQRKYTIIVPPIELQNKFAEFVKQIDKQKFEIEKSLKEMQELYESLMDKYFG